MPSRNTCQAAVTGQPQPCNWSCKCKPHKVQCNSRAGGSEQGAKGHWTRFGCGRIQSSLHLATLGNQLGFRAKTTPAYKANHHTERAANAAAAITILQRLLCQTSATIPQLQCKQVQLQYVQGNSTCDDAVPSNATTGKNHSNTPQQAGAKANADSSTSPSETRMGQSIQTQVQPKCNTIARRAAWQHQCKRICNASVNTNATQVQTQWKPADICKPVHTQCKRKCKHNCNRRNSLQVQVQVQA